MTPYAIAKLELTLIKLRATEFSGVLYIDFVDKTQRVFAHEKVKITNGYATGQYNLPPTLMEGDYTARAYSAWMRNGSDDFFFYFPFKILSSITDHQKHPRLSGLKLSVEAKRCYMVQMPKVGYQNLLEKELKLCPWSIEKKG